MTAADAPNSGDRRRNRSKYEPAKVPDKRHVTDESKRKNTGEDTFPGSTITGDDLEFIRAMERYQRENRRPFPTFTEVLKVAKSLGYRKVAAADTPETLETDSCVR